MKLSTGWIVAVGLLLAVGGTNAQVLPRYQLASDFGGRYTEVPAPRYGAMLLPAPEVYTLLRENGFSPLGAPRQHGYVYSIAAIDRNGEDGELTIDARDGRIIRFLPAYGGEESFFDDTSTLYGAIRPRPYGAIEPRPYGAAEPLPQVSPVRGVPRPPASIPHVASRAVPLPKASPLAAKRLSEPVQPSAVAQPSVVQSKPVEAPQAAPQVTQQTTPQATASVTVGQARPPAAPIAPTQEMPKMQGLE